MRALSAAGAALTLPHAATRADMPAEQPNIVLIMTDDQGYGDLGCHGNDVIDTPSVDRFSTQAIEMTDFAVCPVCAPTRAGLMTGRHCYRTGVWETYRGGETLRLDEVTIAECLRDAGYETGIFGKWHLGDIYPWVPSNQGFNDGLYFRHGNWPYYDVPIERNNQPVDNPGYLTDVFTDAAMEFIEKNQDGPFFCYVPYNAPHAPLQMPQHYEDKYMAMDLDENTAKCYGMIECIDDNVGRLLKRVDELSLTDSTLVIFMTDNGPQWPRYNCGLRNVKGSVYEGGIRVPFYARWPEHFPAGAKCDSIGGNIDLLPTLLDAAGAPLPTAHKLDGISLMPLLTGEVDRLPDRMMFHHWQRSMAPEKYPNGAARTQKWKLVNGEELYDMESDPGETTDLAADHPDLVQDLSAAYDEWWDDASTERGFVRLPVPIGTDGDNPAKLIAMHAYIDGDARYQYGGLLQDRIMDWESTDDVIYWDVDVETTGTYEASLEYRAADASQVSLTAADQTLEADVVATEGRDWTSLPIGTLNLTAGPVKLSVQASSITGNSVMDLHEIRLKLLG